MREGQVAMVKLAYRMAKKLFKSAKNHTALPTAAFTRQEKRAGRQSSGGKSVADGKTRPRIALSAAFGAGFTRSLAREIVKNLTTLGQLTTRPFRHQKKKENKTALGERPILVDTSVLIDGRILPIVSSGFLSGTLVIPRFILSEVQHIADSSDNMRRAKGRRALEVVGKLTSQKANPTIRTRVVREDEPEVAHVDQKLVALSRRFSARLLTVDFNLGQVARAQGVKVLSVNDLAQVMKIALLPGEEVTIKITHEGRERAQGVGYLADGTMVVVDNARDRVGQEVVVTVTKVHQTPAGQLFFARLR